jgi:hypothetical protein
MEEVNNHVTTRRVFLLPFTKQSLEYGLIKEKTFPSKNEVQKSIRKDTKKIQGHKQSS